MYSLATDFLWFCGLVDRTSLLRSLFSIDSSSPGSPLKTRTKGVFFPHGLVFGGGWGGGISLLGVNHHFTLTGVATRGRKAINLYQIIFTVLYPEVKGC